MEGQHRHHVHIPASSGTVLINRCPPSAFTVAPPFRAGCAFGTDLSPIAS